MSIMAEAGDSENGEPGKREVDSLKTRLQDERRKSEDYLNRLKYLQADFENYRKRTEKEAKEREETALRRMVEALLTPLDELELAIENVRKAGEGGELLEGLMMVHKNLAASLGSAGLQRIDSVGKPFDSAMHEAVEKVEGTTEGEDMVTEEIRPGYTFRGKVLRPSMVKVELAPRERGEQEAAASE